MRKILAALKIIIISSSLKKQLDDIKLIFENMSSDLEIKYSQSYTNELLFNLSKEPENKQKIVLRKVKREIKVLQQWREKMCLFTPIQNVKIPQTIENPFEEGRLLPINNTCDYIALSRFYNTIYPILENLDHRYRKISGTLNHFNSLKDVPVKEVIPEK